MRDRGPGTAIRSGNIQFDTNHRITAAVEKSLLRCHHVEELSPERKRPDISGVLAKDVGVFF